MGTSAVLALALLLAAACGVFAEPVKITFLPPPMEGTLSLGVYDAAGKLVRVLHQEIEPGELTKGDDGLETQWDGKDDQGKPCPPGTYRARGVTVGDLGVEGVGFIGNDWVDDDDSPRVRRITALGMSDKGTPFIETRPDSSVPLYYSVILKPAATSGEDPDAQLVREAERPPIRIYKALVPHFEGAVSYWGYGFNRTLWTIKDNIVRQYSDTDKLAKKALRTLSVQPGDPPPVKLAASQTEDKLYVLYENATLQRLRGYDFTGVKPGEEPKVLFEQDIRASDTYEQIASELKFPDEKPFVPSPTLTVALIPNPLDHNKPGSLEIKACLNRAGCYLATTDGLPLSHISDTRFLRWAVLGQPAGSKAITLFDSDGAVVEQFQIANSANMMAFDAGAIPWPGEAPTPTATPAAPAKQ
ncbi:MAG: FlgD immunoglobulin-like domain containing protein [Verrucomicrobiota bacterium]